MTHINQLTLRGLDPKVQRAIRELARVEGISLNKAALRLLEKGAGIERRPEADRIGYSLDHLFGGWSEREAEAFRHSTQVLEQVEEELWR